MYSQLSFLSQYKEPQMRIQKHIFRNLENYEISTLKPAKIVWFLILNIIILQFVQWMCLKIGGHLDIQISYKILVEDTLVGFNSTFLLEEVLRQF